MTTAVGDAKVGSSKMTERVAKLLTQAERAPEGSPEREAFMERAMALAQVYAIDLAIARAHQAKKERVEKPEDRRYQVGQRGGARLPKGRNAHLVDLFLAITQAHNMRCMIGNGNVNVWAHGMPSDHEVVERMFAVLSVQMVAGADAALKRGDHKVTRRVPKTRRVDIPDEARDWGGWDGRSQYYDERNEAPDGDGYVYSWATCRYRKAYPPPKTREEPVLDEDGNQVWEDKQVSTVDGRVWRANFYASFVSRTRSRLWAARQDALEKAGIDPDDDTDTAAVALRDKAKEVDASFEEHNKAVLATSGTYGGAEVSTYHTGAWWAGSAAAEAARLGDEMDLPTS